MFKVLNRKNKVFFLVLSAFCAVFLFLCGVNCYKVNSKAYRQEKEYYSIGEFAELNGNFFFDANEKTNGYSIKVNSMEIVDYSKLLNEYGREVSVPSNYPIADSVILLNVTVKNDGNSEGCLPFSGFSIFHDSLQIPIDFEILNMIDSKIDGNTALKLKTDSEASLTLPFSAMPLDEAINPKKINEILKNGELILCVCEFPTRKLIFLRKD